MIRLSDVKVRLQYRWRVRQPRLKLEDGNLREKLEKVEAQILRETLQRSAPSPRPPVTRAWRKTQSLARRNGTASAADPRAPWPGDSVLVGTLSRIHF